MTTTPIASWIAMLVGPSSWQLRSTGGLSSAASKGIAAGVLAAGRAALYDVEATEALIAASAQAAPLRQGDATRDVGRWERRASEPGAGSSRWVPRRAWAVKRSDVGSRAQVRRASSAAPIRRHVE